MKVLVYREGQGWTQDFENSEFCEHLTRRQAEATCRQLAGVWGGGRWGVARGIAEPQPRGGYSPSDVDIVVDRPWDEERDEDDE